MAIRKRGDAWQADVIVAGRRVRKDFATEALAAEWAAAERDRLVQAKKAKVQPTAPADGRKGPPTGDAPATFGDACDRTFTRYYKGTRWERKTGNALKQLRAYWGDATPLAEIDASAVDSFVERLRAEGKAPSSINQRLAFLGKVLRFAAGRGSSVSVPKMEREKVSNGRIRWINGDEEANMLRLLRQWGKEDVAEVVEALIDTGFRQSELFGLVARDVSVKARSVTVWRTKTETPRTIYMTPRVLAIMERRIKATPAGDPLFPYNIWWLRHSWDRARAKIGLANDEQFVPYVCRHTCASRMVQRGVSLPAIKEWMGHAGIQMTMRYAHIAPANLKEAADALGWDAAD